MPHLETWARQIRRKRVAKLLREAKYDEIAPPENLGETNTSEMRLFILKTTQIREQWVILF